jgi:hypothetical protein
VANDAHEFTVLEDGTALTTIFESAQYDLSSYGRNQTICIILRSRSCNYTILRSQNYHFLKI